MNPDSVSAQVPDIADGVRRLSAPSRVTKDIRPEVVISSTPKWTDRVYQNVNTNLGDVAAVNLGSFGRRARGGAGPAINARAAAVYGYYKQRSKRKRPRQPARAPLQVKPRAPRTAL
ncbi:hypothetical protein EVAR_64103_1 [Eumeta japonica]|uniref:Uncharacterized protein n=1 Tax=Eumeta variegata TaxID=151549 RepID=A0A4C1ZIN2_EUMVA|nr:hypothetical protein EVAR_64103_1 [Eumeta japonica]